MISRDIVAEFGGELRAADATDPVPAPHGPGRGALFILTLRKASPSRIMSRSASSAPPSGAAALPAKPAVRVVFIDDDAELRRANSQTLKLHGFQVEAHASARAALPVLTRAFDGVVVTDIRMPDMDGLQLFSGCATSTPNPDHRPWRHRHRRPVHARGRL